MTAYTSFTSSLTRTDVRVNHADRANTIGQDISDNVVECFLGGDVERVVGKMSIELTSFNKDDIGPNQWVAPFITVTPESGDVVTEQYGLYRLDVPNISVTPNGAIASNEGVDVIGTFRGALPEEMITPARIVLMDEISYTMERASLKHCGANVLPNPAFENAVGAGITTGWTVSSWPGASNELVVVESTNDAATNVFPYLSHGSFGYRLRAPNGSVAVGGSTSISTDSSVRIPISPNMQEVYGETLVWMNTNDLSARLEVWFYDSTGAEMGAGFRLSSSGDVPPYRRPIWPESWIRMIAYGPVPQDAASCRLVITVRRHSNTEFTGTNLEAVVDFVALRRAIGPMFTRHRLPKDYALTRAQIGHPAQTMWTDRLADLVSSSAYHSPFNDHQGFTTTKPVKDMPNETAVATFTIGGDSRLVEGMQILPSKGNFYNTVTLISEDYTNGTTMISNVVNDDPNNPWSVNQIGEYAPETPFIVTSVVNQAALDQLARNYLARASMQQTIELAILPDPKIQIHDIIVIEGQDDAEGRWRVETLEIDASPEGDGLLHIGARRSLTWGFGI